MTERKDAPKFLAALAALLAILHDMPETRLKEAAIGFCLEQMVKFAIQHDLAVEIFPDRDVEGMTKQ